MSPMLKLLPFYIQSLKYREIDVVYAGLTMESRIFATYMRASADGGGTAWSFGGMAFASPI
ncbi:hypothetical protein Rleg4DRAFT_1151 [Rhizobium leguminosarum bv. trifolii WSM2297]|uniref:Uncharacterized protein n=1 Tax=Rhizobium leguminosarum bv. trifolii WSM2297 TaxID=754762 RepID=J0CJ95_RHILT|nr:hypothetical protein [Rhizobium leguminosarum]EJC79555.1 hypothetical protein Rleg4DRAFT_1151 [Rhizobium leguminosarum bv. trifolii WSM2297]